MSQDNMHSGIVSPKGIWWKDIPPQEKRWITISFVWCMILFAMMPLWHIRGGQNPSGIRHKVAPADFMERTERFVEEFKVGEEAGFPVVEPPPGSHVYLLARMWQWYPVLKLKKGAEYIFHLSSMDVNHGFGLFPLNINFQVVPGYDYGLKMVPDKAGDYRIICNEFCGIGHHMMVGKILVTE
jgi:cytochrome c oxidase subunit 2